jgi:phage/plasmid-associated DNA primase
MGKKVHCRYVKQAVSAVKIAKTTKQKKVTKEYQLEHEEYHWQKRTNQGTECEEKRSSAELEIYDESNENNNYQLIRTEAIELLNGASMPSRFKFRD